MPEHTLAERLKNELGLSQKGADVTSLLLEMLSPPGVVEAVQGEDMSVEEGGLIGVLAGAVGKKGRAAKKLAERGMRVVEGGVKEPRGPMKSGPLAKQALLTAKKAEAVGNEGVREEMRVTSNRLVGRMMRNQMSDTDKFQGALMSQQAQRAALPTEGMQQFGDIMSVLKKFNISQDSFNATIKAMHNKNQPLDSFTQHVQALSRSVESGDMTVEAAKSSLVKTMFDILRPQ